MSDRLYIMALSGLLLLGGCYEERIVRDSFTDLRDLAGSQNRQRTTRGMMAQSGGWTILLAEFEGSNRDRRAEQLVQRLTHEAFVGDLWLDSGDGKTRVLRGVYPGPDSEMAQYDLLRTQHITINGSQPYTHARLVPLGHDGSVAGDSDYDLRRYSGRLSLQIGYFDEAMGPTFRKAAEEYVKTLRSEGEEAYFYHGPNMSHVTIGLFGEEDRLQRVMRTPEGHDLIMTDYSPRVRELQRRYPYNLGNGHTMLARTEDGASVPLESFLVEIP